MSSGIYLLLGTNLGSRLQNLREAKRQINIQIGKVVKESFIYETEPWGVSDQPQYLNEVVEISTSLKPTEILRRVLLIEKGLGRIRQEKWGARIVDIDLLFYNDETINTTALQVPHPRLHERNFTLIPLAEIAPDFIHPVFQKSIQALLEESTDQLVVSKFSESF